MLKLVCSLFFDKIEFTFLIYEVYNFFFVILKFSILSQFICIKIDIIFESVFDKNKEFHKSIYYVR